MRSYFPAKPTKAFNTFDHFFNDVFNKSLGSVIGNDFVNHLPSVNVIETENDFNLELAAPGLEKSDFNIQVDKGIISIEAKKETKEETTKEGKFTRREFNFASFKRSFHLPETVDSEKILATYEQGILKVTLPKFELVEPETKTIQIN